jgi:hypothetical protein
MTEFGYQILLAVSLGSGMFSLFLAALKRDPSWWSVGSALLTEAMLLIQLVWSIVIVSAGSSAKGDTIEFFGYILTALLVPAGAVVWAVFERTKWSTMVIGLASLTVAVMAVRMWQIWSGNVPHF